MNVLQELLLLHPNFCSHVADRMLQQPQCVCCNILNCGATVAQHLQDVVDKLPDVLFDSAYVKAEVPVVGEEEDGGRHNVALS